MDCDNSARMAFHTVSNVEALNDTGDLYRYFNCTEEGEFLYSCLRRTVEANCLQK
jgi:hypothetical protein